MTIDHSGKNCVLGISSEDCQAFLCFVELETIRNLLEPISPAG